MESTTHENSKEKLKKEKMLAAKKLPERFILKNIKVSETLLVMFLANLLMRKEAQFDAQVKLMSRSVHYYAII